MKITLTILGEPIAKKRPRFVRRGKFVGTYNCQETEEGKFKWEIFRQLPPGWSALKYPIKITTTFYLRRPKNHYGTGKNSTQLKKSAPANHSSAPDLDNLQKMVYDCFNQVVWVDDSLVCEANARKEYSENPRTEIIVVEVDEYGERTEDGW